MYKFFYKKQNKKYSKRHVFKILYKRLISERLDRDPAFTESQVRLKTLLPSILESGRQVFSTKFRPNSPRGIDQVARQLQLTHSGLNNYEN